MAEFRLNVISDEDGKNPRHDCDCYLGVLACWHRRYSLSDENAVDTLLDEIHKTRPNFQYDEPAELWQACEKAGMIVKPVYLYDHSGLAVSTSPFNCPWDSGQVGFIAAPKSRIREMLGVKRITAKVIKRVFKSLESEIKWFNTYLAEGVYGFKLEEKQDGKWVEVGSSWGFVGSDVDENGMIDNFYIDRDKDSLLVVNESGYPEPYYYDFKAQKVA